MLCSIVKKCSEREVLRERCSERSSQGGVSERSRLQKWSWTRSPLYAEKNRPRRGGNLTTMTSSPAESEMTAPSQWSILHCSFSSMDKMSLALMPGVSGRVDCADSHLPLIHSTRKRTTYVTYSGLALSKLGASWSRCWFLSRILLALARCIPEFWLKRTGKAGRWGQIKTEAYNSILFLFYFLYNSHKNLTPSRF